MPLTTAPHPSLQTLMAHGTLLTDEDISFLATKNVGVAHCPLSNFFVGDACFKWVIRD